MISATSRFNDHFKIFIPEHFHCICIGLNFYELSAMK